jgi:hypothetical protein
LSLHWSGVCHFGGITTGLERKRPSAPAVGCWFDSHSPREGVKEAVPHRLGEGAPLWPPSLIRPVIHLVHRRLGEGGSLGEGTPVLRSPQPQYPVHSAKAPTIYWRKSLVPLVLFVLFVLFCLA